jgi:Pilus formation protein N terminal region
VKCTVPQSKIAEVEVASPDTVVVHGKAIGAISLVIWFEEPVVEGGVHGFTSYGCSVL